MKTHFPPSPTNFEGPPQNELSSLKQKASSTLRTSQAVPHPSTDRAFGCLTSEFRWDRVCSTEYGRWRKYAALNWSQSLFKIFPPFPTIDRKSYKSSHHFPPSIGSHTSLPTISHHRSDNSSAPALFVGSHFFLIIIFRTASAEATKFFKTKR